MLYWCQPVGYGEEYGEEGRLEIQDFVEEAAERTRNFCSPRPCAKRSKTKRREEG